jgi:hypothetical protein
MQIEGHRLEILAIEAAHCADSGPTNGDPLCLFTFRPTPKDRGNWVLMWTPEQCLRIRDTLDEFLNDPESALFLPLEKQEEIRAWCAN